MKKANEEYHLQVAVTDFLRLEYPDVIFRSDLAGIRLPIHLAKKAKRIQGKRGFPDLTIYRARHGFHGLVLELKISRDQVYKKDGSFRNNSHINEQANTLFLFNKEGYQAMFSCGYHQTIGFIRDYLG